MQPKDRDTLHINLNNEKKVIICVVYHIRRETVYKQAFLKKCSGLDPTEWHLQCSDWGNKVTD